MLKYSRLMLSIALSFLIVVTGTPFQLYCQAQSNSSEPELSPEAENQKSIEQLRQAFADPSKGEAHLDPFQLTRQRVTDDRQKNLDALTEEELQKDYRERVEYLEEKVRELSRLEADVLDKLSALNGNEAEKVTELNLIRDDIVSRRKITELELQDARNHNPSLGKGLPVELMIDPTLRKRHYWGRRLRIKVGGVDAPMGEVRQRDFTQSLSPKFSKENPVTNQSLEVGTGFVLADHRGRLLNEFFKPVEALFFFGQYLVYVEREALQKADKVLPVRFIDLNYFRANIGNAQLPVYTLPLNISEAPEEFKIESGRLVIGEHRLSHQQFDILAKTQQIIFNVNVALVDPQSYKNALPLIQEITDFFGKAMQGQDKLFQAQMEKSIQATDFLNDITGNLRQRAKLESVEAESLIEAALKDGKLSNSEYEAIKTALDADSILGESNNAIRAGRSLMTRIRLLMRFLVEPRPEGAPKLFNALVITATGDQESRQRIIDGAKNSFAFKLAKYGAATGGVLLAASFLPEPYTINLHKTMDLASAISQHFQGYLQHIQFGKAYAELSADAFVTSTTGWTYFFQSYMADGKWAKFLYGLGHVLLVPLKLFASIHFGVNSYKMFRKTIEVRSLSNGEYGFLKSFKEAAKADSKAYWDSLAEAEKKSSGSDVSEIKEGEVRLLEEHVKRLREGRDGLNAVERDIRQGKYGTRSSLGQFMEVISGYTRKLHFGQSVSGMFKNATSKLSIGGGSEDTFRRALTETFLSYSSLRTTFKANAITWNYLFVTRSFFWSPSKWLMMLIYPNYFGVTLTTTQGKQHIPSPYNRGLETWPQKLNRFMSRVGQSAGAGKVPVVKNMLISKEGLQALGSFEKAVAPIEDIAKEVALKKAQIALIENIKDPQRILNIFESSQNSHGTTTGIKNLHDKKLKKLTAKERIFYRAYFTRTFDLLMQNFILELTSTELSGEMTPEEFARRFKAELRNGQHADFSVNNEAILAVEEKVESQLDFNKIRDWANKVGQNAESTIRRLNIAFRHRLLESLHHENFQLNRFLVARQKVNEPRAMERAMRMEVSSLFSSIPLGIISTLALYAGVQTGVIQPFDPEGMNTETHFRYMSRYLFYSGFIPGLIVGLMANTWGKVQEDSRIDSLGGFDKTIKHSDGIRGFWRYYLKNAFKNPVNKWKDNQLFMLKLITANIPAAAVTIIASNLYGLGRVDVGAFIGGYIMIYATFLAGFSFKMEQAFELASNWVANKIPRKLRAHKEAQRYISASLQKRKIMFSYVETAWGIIVDENIAGTMLVLKDNVKFGTRAFLRLVFGGETPTEIIAKVADQMIQAFRGVPGLESATEMVKQLFTKNFEAFERFPERLEKVPGVERVMENPNLPKNLVGEVIGKGAAAAATIGGVASIPYVVTDLFNRRKQQQLQKRGQALRCSHVFTAN